MDRRSALQNFTVRIKSKLLLELLQRVVDRAYERGYEDAQKGRAEDKSRVKVDPLQLRKFQ